MFKLTKFFLSLKSILIKSTNVKSKDLRGGAALLTAALSIKGRSVIEGADYILRGYENLDRKLNSLGANVKLVKSS